LEPLRMVVTHASVEVRREALRGIGKLQKRAPLDPQPIVPLLVGAIADPDGTVRAVAATYLGIVKAAPELSIPALIRALADPDPPVRMAAATALEEFGEAALPALPALKKAAADRDQDVAREAGRAIVTLSAKNEPISIR
jgi:HEAT repeat protein